jgi:hypothetical protein
MENALMMEGGEGGQRRKFTYKSNYFYILTWEIEEAWALLWVRRAARLTCDLLSSDNVSCLAIRNFVLWVGVGVVQCSTE